MSDVKAKLLTSGKALITSALTGFSALGPTRFRVGNLAGFEPDKADTDVRGALVFEGLSGLIQARRIEVDTVRYTLTITEQYGPFQIGNVVLFGSLQDGDDTPYVQVVLPFAVTKKATDPNVGAAAPFPTAGARFAINITVKHSVDDEDVTVEVINPNYSSLPYFDTEQNLPGSLVNPFGQFVVNNDSRVNTPVLVAKSADASYWGIPFWQNLRDPKFGVIDGGVAGDGHLTDQGAYMWGYYYLTPDELLGSAVGGTGYIQDNTLGYVAVVGGEPY